MAGTASQVGFFRAKQRDDYADLGEMSGEIALTASGFTIVLHQTTSTFDENENAPVRSIRVGSS